LIKPSKKTIKRVSRIGAFGLGAGLSFMGAGNLMGFGAFESAIFGASGSLIGLATGYLFNYAIDGILDDSEFDAGMKQAVDVVHSKTKKEK
jgi:hypothetical protein